MIDLNLLRENPAKTIAQIIKKEPTYDAERLAALDIQLRDLRLEVEQLRAQKNEFAAQGKGGVTDQLRELSSQVSQKLKEKEKELEVIEKEFKQLYLECPNILVDEIPFGGKESNKVVKTVGQKQSFAFEPKHHLDLGNALGWLDFQAAATMTGSQFALYKGQAVNLMYSLALFLLKNNIKHGYSPILPPYVVNETSLMVASNLPKFKDQLYEIEKDQLYLTPTAEANLANMYRDQILNAEQLPIRMTAWTSCFRREAGGYGAHERGLIRMHQFEKVELFTICEPEQSPAEFDRMVACVEDALQQLGLHYQLALLAAQDASFASAKTIDVEVWLPGQKQYYEVSSISNCTDFQARRGKIRYKKDATSKPVLVHTLNGSSIALSRLVVALMETYQQADGTIKLPPALEKERIF